MCRQLARTFAGLAIAAAAGSAHADVVTDWNQIMSRMIFSPPATSNLVTSRVAAIMHAAVFDAVNGIERRYTPIHVDPAAPRGASRRAAAIQAAYATLVVLYPSQKGTLDAARQASLQGITDDGDLDDSKSIQRGIDWGQTVADAIIAWRSTDGFTSTPPPFTGGTDVGEWRPTPPAFLPGAAPQFATMTPWVLATPWQFRPSGPALLASDQYATDFNEVKSIGSSASTTRTDFQTEVARFWSGNTALYWNRIALTMAAQNNTSLSDNARLFALLNVAIADAAIACWDGKYTYVFWRPISAIQLADTDGNAATDPDPSWTPLLVTPNFPEYPSAHATVSPAAAVVLQSIFGDSGPYTLDSEILPGVLHSFTSFAGAADEAFVARIYGGIHFRTSCQDGHDLGLAVGNFIVANAALPRH